MNYSPTYFQNRIDQAALSRLLSERASFHLENVDNVDLAADNFAQVLHDHGLKVRTHEQRVSVAREMAITLLPLTVRVLLLVQMLYRDAVVRWKEPHPDVLIFKRNGAVEVRHKKRPK